MSVRPLAVDGELRAERAGGRHLTLSGRGSTLVLEADRLSTLRDLRGRIAPGPVALDELLRRSDLAIEVRSGGHTVAVARPGLAPGFLARLLRTSPFRLRLGRLVAAWWARRGRRGVR